MYTTFSLENLKGRELDVTGRKYWDETYRDSVWGCGLDSTGSG